MTKNQANQERACAAARIQEMKNELNSVESLRFSLALAISKIDHRKMVLEANIIAEQNSVKAL
jgi:hypothetical protein